MGSIPQCCNKSCNFCENIIEKENNSQFSQRISIKKDKDKINNNFDIKQFLSSSMHSNKNESGQYDEKYFENLYNQCKISIKDDDFNLDNWKKYYPIDEQFFLFEKGEVFPNKVKVSNSDDQNNLEIYDGEINSEGKKHGYGVLTTPRYILKGTWRNGEFTGWGKEYMTNGDIYEGKFVNGVLSGIGIFHNQNSKYVGDFVNGYMEGNGELTSEKYHYKGEFKNNKFNGKGVLKLLQEGNEYEGDFENNEIKGKGIFKFKNGDIYEGELKKGKFHGKGVYKYNNGKIYEGQYMNGVKEGHGKLINSDGSSYEGNFKNGNLDGTIIYNKEGKSHKLIFSEGKYISKEKSQT